MSQRLSRLLKSWLVAMRFGPSRTDVSPELLKQGASWVFYLHRTVSREMTSNEPYYKKHLVRWSHFLLA